MNLRITERWLREKTNAEENFPISAGPGLSLGELIEEAEKAKSKARPSVAVAAEAKPVSRPILTIIQMRDELKTFMTSSTQTVAMAARNFEKMTDNDVRLMYEQVELLKKMAAGGGGR